MKKEDQINKKINIAEKSILKLIQSEDLKKLSEQIAYQIAQFYETKSLNRIETAKLIYHASQDDKQKYSVFPQYSDYSEAVAAAYYAMYYIVHAYLSAAYKTKLREDMRGVHAITHHIILYYLIKTKKLAQYLYEEYVVTLETISTIQNLTVESFQEEAYAYAEKYDKSRIAREIFTYKTTSSIEAHHAEQAIKTAEEFINTIRQLIHK